MANIMDPSGRRFRSHPATAGAAGGAYGLATIGAAVYFIGHAAGFWAGVLGLIKALLWPAFVIYALMLHLGM